VGKGYRQATGCVQSQENYTNQTTFTATSSVSGMVAIKECIVAGT
jgi:hypothetical protein